MDIVWRIVATLALVGLNGFFVAAEFAAVGARQSRLETEGGTGIFAQLSLQVKKHLDLYLSSCQLGITIASLALGYVTEPAIVELLKPIFGQFGYPAEAFEEGPIHIIAVAIALAISTTLHVVVGEVAPKNYAIFYPDRALPIVALPLITFTYIFYPVIWTLNSLSNLLLRLLGIKVGPEAHGLIPHSVEELRALLTESVERGAIPQTQEDILTSAFDFGDLKARQIMTPRTEVDYLKLGQPLDEVLKAIQRTSFTRLPLCEGDLDHVLGLVHVKDLFNQLRLVPGKLRFADETTPEGMAVAVADGQPGSMVHVIGSADLDLDQIKREIFYVPELLPVPKLLRMFQSSRTHIAVVVDEYGSTAGIVTLEDVIEEIVGDIEDEFDVTARPNLIREGESVRVGGMYALHELDDAIDFGEIEADGVDTLSGYITQELGRWPRPGDAVPMGRYTARVLSVQQRRVAQALLVPNPEPQEEG